jgi:hypothetical protein
MRRATRRRSRRTRPTRADRWSFHPGAVAKDRDLHDDRGRRRGCRPDRPPHIRGQQIPLISPDALGAFRRVREEWENGLLDVAPANETDKSRAPTSGTLAKSLPTRMALGCGQAVTSGTLRVAAPVPARGTRSPLALTRSPNARSPNATMPPGGGGIVDWRMLANWEKARFRVGVEPAFTRRGKAGTVGITSTVPGGTGRPAEVIEDRPTCRARIRAAPDGPLGGSQIRLGAARRTDYGQHPRQDGTSARGEVAL